MATDIPDPTALDEAIWQLYVAVKTARPGRGGREWHVARAARTLFPKRALTFDQERYGKQEWLREYKARRRRANGIQPRRTGPDREREREYQRLYKRAERQRRGEQIKANKRAWYAKNRDRINAARRAKEDAS